MKRVKNTSLRQFFSELRFAPRTQRINQINAAEELLSIIEAGKSYPLDFICYRVTDYRLKTEPKNEMIPADELAEALHTFILNVSRQISFAANEENSTVYSADQLAARFSISAKTIQRWRKKGFVAKTYLFNDGTKRLGFRQSSIDFFLHKNPGTMQRAKNFTRITDHQKKQIIKRGKVLAAKSKYNRYQITKMIAGETSRSPEAIRLILIDHDKNNPDRSVFRRPSHAITSREGAQIYKLHRQGTGIGELMKKFERSRSSIYRIINRRRAKALLIQKIEYIDSGDFLEQNAEKKILAQPISDLAKRKPLDAKKPPPHLLTRQQEMELFREYNYLKYLACLTRAKIDRVRPSSKRLRNIEHLLERAEDIKTTILESNIGLVVRIAQKHLATGTNLSELISEGNVSLMRTVEKFDYLRGYRFNTYASLAIAKDFAKKIPAQARRPDRSNADELSNIQQDLRTAGLVDIAEIERAHHSLDYVIKNNLDEREQFIIRNHFGLDSTIARKKHMTLQQIGDTFNITRERVRQLELIALKKLRQCLSPEEFDLLTK